MSAPVPRTAPVLSPAWWFWARVLFRPLLFWPKRLRVRGRHHVPRTGPVLIVSNHVSQADPPLLGGAALPRKMYYMAKIELFRIPGVRWGIRGLGAFPIDRGGADREALRIAREILRRGDVLLMFPEGTRSVSGRLRPGLPGAGSLGLEPGVTVVPAAVWGSQRLLSGVRVVLGPPLDLSDLPEGPRSRRAQAAVDRMMTAIAGLLVEAGGPAQEPPISPRAGA